MSRVATLLLVGAVVLATTGLAGCAAGSAPPVEIVMRFSRFAPVEIRAARGVPIRFELRNEDPIDHEWLIGDEAFHERHRTGAEADHGASPEEQSVGAGSTVRTTVTFEQPGRYRYVCHLPGHEAYGMVGVVIVG